MTIRKIKNIDLSKMKPDDTAAVLIHMATGQVALVVRPVANASGPGTHVEVEIEATPVFSPHQRKVIRQTARECIRLIQAETDPEPLKPDAITPEQRNFPADLTGHRVVLRQDRFHGSLAKRTVMVTGGGGARKNSLGTKIFYRADDGTEDYVRIGDISHMAASG